MQLFLTGDCYYKLSSLNSLFGPSKKALQRDVSFSPIERTPTAQNLYLAGKWRTENQLLSLSALSSLALGPEAHSQKAAPGADLEPPRSLCKQESSPKLLWETRSRRRQAARMDITTEAQRNSIVLPSSAIQSIRASAFKSVRVCL